MTQSFVIIDIDGVLVTGKSMRRNRNRSRPFDTEAVCALNHIIRETCAVIVISSTWRHQRSDAELDELMMLEGVPANTVFGATSRETRALIEGSESMLWRATSRGAEIRMWIAEHPKFQNFVVIDDDPSIERDGDLPQDRCFRTDFEQGLTDDVAQAVIERLKRR